MNSNTPQPNTAPPILEEGTHLRDYINVVLRRWKVAVLVFALVFLGVAARTFLTQPVYEANVTLQVNKQSQGGMLKELGMESDNSLAADIEILRSRSMAEAVARQLHLDWRTAEVSPGLEFRLGQLQVEPGVPALVVELTGPESYRLLDAAGQKIGAAASGEELKAPGLSFVLEIRAGRKGDRLRLERQPIAAVAGEILDGIRAQEMGKGTNILRLSYQSTSPVQARDVANALAQAYYQQSITSKTREAGKTVNFINNQLVGIKQTLDRTEQDLQEYKVESGMVTLGPEGQSLVEKLVNLETKKMELGLRRKRIEFAIDSLQKALATDQSYNPTLIETVPLSRDIGARLADLEAEKKGLLKDFTEAHPAVRGIQQQIRKSQEALLTAYQAGLQDLALEEKDLATTIAGYEGQLQGIPQAELELAKRSRVNKVNAELYTFLLQKEQEARIAQASTLSNVEIIDSAYTPTVPVKPNKKKNLLLGLVLGMMLGVGLAFFLDYLDDTVNDAEEVRNGLGLAVLGIIPRIADSKLAADDPAATLITSLEPKSAPVEAFRALRTGIHFATARETRKLILVTSSLPDEGKTTISANLALVLSQTGARVLLVGCDLRRPGLYDMFHTPATPGLSDHLTGDVVAAPHAIAGTTLELLSAGTVPPNPVELLGSPRMEQFLNEVRERYDYIVLDAPPVLPVTDAQILAHLADDVVIVLEPCRIPRKAARRMVETLRAVNAHIIGAALNDKSGKGFKYYGNYGYYGHKYYGGYYGEGKKTPEPVGVMTKLKKFLG